MTKYFHITITTALDDKDDFYVYFRGNSKDEIYYTLYDFIEDNLDEVATKYFDSDEITETEYREAMNQIFGNLD